MRRVGAGGGCGGGDSRCCHRGNRDLTYGEKAEGDGPKVKQVWKPPSASEKLAPAHLIEEERCRFVIPSDRQVEGEER